MATACVDVKGYSVEVKGHSVDVKGHSVDVKGHSVDVTTSDHILFTGGDLPDATARYGC